MKCCDITPGILNRKISIEAETITTTPTGGQSVTWSQVANPWARLKPMTGREKVHADRLDAVGMTQVIIRYRSDLDESMRVVYRDKVYNIRSLINVEEADEYIEILMERGVSQ